jgi:glycine oxidase
VARADGELRIGAADEEHPAGEGTPLPPVGGVARLLETARVLVPRLGTAELLDVVARAARQPCQRPLLGPVAGPGPARVLLASGHHRGGVLLAPVTAATLCAHVDGLNVPDAARPFTPDRSETHRIERDEDPFA